VNDLLENEGPEHNARGLFVAGPQMVNPSDVLARIIDAAKGRITDQHYAPTPDAERKKHVRQKGREALRRKYAVHGIPEFLRQLAS
jgi:hypothetical protein